MLSRQEPASDDAEIGVSGLRAKAVWSAESAAERDRLLALPPAARLAALDDDAARVVLTAEHRAEVRASLAPEPAVRSAVSADTDAADRKARRAAWERDRAAMVRFHIARA